MGQRIYDTSSVHRISQGALVRHLLTTGISPATVTEIVVMIAQMESQIQAPFLSVTITSAFPGFQRSMTYQSGTWSGHDLTHHFHDHRASISYSSASRGVRQNRPRQLFAATAPPQQTLPTALAQARESASSPASSPRIPTPPDMSNCPITEQARMSALQAMAANLDYSDFMRIWNNNGLACEPLHHRRYQ